MIFPSVTKEAQTDEHGIARFDVKGEPVEVTIMITNLPFNIREEIHLAHPVPHQVEVGIKP
jgi:hypothetical protein